MMLNCMSLPHQIQSLPCRVYLYLPLYGGLGNLQHVLYYFHLLFLLGVPFQYTL